MVDRFDVAVVGGGIVGLAHAWTAARRGLSVVLIERSKVASGASIRNFGMVWPIGQPSGVAHEMALRSRELWLDASNAAGFWANPCGSLHLAHRQDEMAVLEEFVRSAEDSPHDVSLLTPEETLRRSPGAKPDGLLGAMWSPTEVCVNPQQAIATLPSWLNSEYGTELRFGETVVNIDGNHLHLSDGTTFHAEKTLICSGVDFQTLFPAVFADAGLKICKLQMLQTPTQPEGWTLGPHLASGLTLRHYKSFGHCPSLEALKRRVADETPELDRYGIHVMASQNNLGQVTLGDSHEYDDEISPFDKPEIEDLMVRELKKQFQLPSWNVAKRWHGIYASHPTKSMVLLQASPSTTICVGPGGAGMTMSFGFADKYWADSSIPEMQS